ncbi:MAG: sigma factor-like helix-turn-helix DNA-binding protein [Actinomycetota bacterium]
MQRVEIEPDTAEIPKVIGFDGFYRTHKDRLYRALVMTIRDADVASEAIDEAMARAAERWNVVADYDAPEGWVYRVALNWSRSVFRRKRPILDPPELTWDALPDPDVTRAVAALPYKFRVVVVARYYLDWTNPEIATGLDIPLGTVKSRIHRALAQLEEHLGGTR